MKKNAATERQRLLKRLMPPLAILVAYFAIIAPRVARETSAINQELDRLKSSSVSPETVSSLEQQTQKLIAEIAQLRKQTSKTDNELAARLGFLGQVDYKPKVIHRLNALLNEHRLSILDENSQGLAAAKTSLPKVVREMGEAVKFNAEAGTSVWSVRVRGAYPDVLKVLDSLSHDALTVIPVSLEMLQPEGEGDMEWIINIWI